MKTTEEEKLIKKLNDQKWCWKVDKVNKDVYVCTDRTSMKFANYSPELKKLTKKMGYKIKLQKTGMV
jgi:hypothetical protein